MLGQVLGRVGHRLAGASTGSCRPDTNSCGPLQPTHRVGCGHGQNVRASKCSSGVISSFRQEGRARRGSVRFAGSSVRPTGSSPFAFTKAVASSSQLSFSKSRLLAAPPSRTWALTRRVSLVISVVVECAAADALGGKEAKAAQEPQEQEELHIPYPETFVKSNGRRVVAVGDLHGDIEQTLEALIVAGVVNPEVAKNPEGKGKLWCGEDTIVVQVGDIMDRGDNEIEIVCLFRQLEQEAKEEGGAVYVLQGNHEVMNVLGDFRYVTRGGYIESIRFLMENFGVEKEGEWTAREAMSARYSLFGPGGPVALMLASNPTVLQIDQTIFAHGGIHESALEYGFERLNKDVSDWMRGKEESPPQLVMGAQGVVWTRAYGHYCRCGPTKELLEKCGANRLVVGHTPQQQGLNACCDGMVWRIDVGMSTGMLGATPQVIEIKDGGKDVQVLKGPPALFETGDVF